MTRPHAAPLRRSALALSLFLILGRGSSARADDSAAAPATPAAVATPASQPAAALNPAVNLPSARLEYAHSPALLPAVATLGGVALLGLSDHYIWKHVTFAGGPGAQRVADFAQPIGTPAVIGPVLIAGYAGGLLFHKPELSHASARMAASIVFAATTTQVLKMTVGRTRPGNVANGDADEFRAFSGNTSFPSGHTTLAFAAATAIDRETDARWVPWVVYPVAGLVGWSRIHDQMHWMSDVAAGAAVGYFATNAAENFLRSDNRVTRRFSPIFGVGRGTTVGVRFRF